MSSDQSLLDLLELQDIDIAITQANHRTTHMPEALALEQASAKHRRLEADQAEVTTRVETFEAAQRLLEERIAAVAERSKGIERRLYDARNAAPRDLQAMETEIKHLAEQRSELEDEELAIMVDLDPLRADQARLAEQVAESEIELRRCQGAFDEADAENRQQLTALEARRALARPAIDSERLERYDFLRQHLGGVAVARLIGEHCDGCHLTLPSAEVERVRHLPSSEVATCDQCGRILVIAPA